MIANKLHIWDILVIDTGAMYRLGIMYCYGQGVEQSYEKAKQYYERAIEADKVENHNHVASLQASHFFKTKTTVQNHPTHKFVVGMKKQPQNMRLRVNT